MHTEMGKETKRNPREYFYAEVFRLPPGTRLACIIVIDLRWPTSS